MHTPCKKRRLLLVEDDLGIQAALTVALEADFSVAVASTVSEGLYRLAESPPDLVILDIRLPDLDGTDFLRTLRASHPACSVIVITGIDDVETFRELTALRIEGFFRKPFDVDELLEHINALLIPGGSVRLSRLRFSRHVNKAIEYLSQSYAQPLTLKAVAGAIGVSASHLANLFKVEVEMTVKEYLAKIRVEVAKRLLLKTDEKLDSLAEMVGFCDASHLSRIFRQHVGCSPGEYRRQSRPKASSRQNEDRNALPP